MVDRYRKPAPCMLVEAETIVHIIEAAERLMRCSAVDASKWRGAEGA